MHVTVIADFIKVYNRRILRGVAAFARIHGWTLRAQQVQNRHDVAHALKTAEAVLMGTHDYESEPSLEGLHVPAVSWSATREQVPWPRVISDDCAVGRMAAEHFLSNGFRRCAFYSDVPGIWSRRRLTGFEKRLEESGIAVDTGPRQFSSGKVETVEKWLAHLTTPVGIMVVHDPAATAVLDACKVLGLRVPDDVAIVGVDNDDLICDITDPPLSAVSLQTDRIGYEAAALLARMTADASDIPTEVLIPPGELIVRRSSDAFAFDDALVAKAIRFIQEHLADGVCTKQVVDHVGCCRETLDIRFREAVRDTVASEIRRQRIAAVKRLLVTTDLPMTEVSKLTGFSCARQLSETFHNETGETPTECRLRSKPTARSL